VLSFYGRIFACFDIVDICIELCKKSRKQMMQNISESTKSENTPKRDIVDTTFHASCAPGTTWTNNMAFLLYGSGLNKQKGAMHNKANGRIFEGFDLMCYAILC